jgi:hypothetical protein
MSNHSMRDGLSDRWAKPRQSLDPSMRRKVHGPIRPMEEPGFFERLFRWG